MIVMSSAPLSYFVVNNKTMFIPFRYVYPECEKLIAPHPQMYPLRCLQEDGCPANMSCMDYLVPRVNYLFDKVSPSSQVMVAYYKYVRLNPGENENREALMGAIFHRDLREPYLMVMNPSGFVKCQKMGEISAWVPTEEYKNLGAHRGIIPVKSLIRER